MILPEKMFRSIDGRYTELVISCTSNQIDATLFYYEDNKLSHALSHVSQPLPLQHPYTKQDIYDMTISTLDDVCREISQKSHLLFSQKDLLADHQTIHKVRLCMSAPWVVARTYQSSENWEKAHIITQSHVNELIDQSISQGHMRLDTRIVSAKANGYQINVDAVLGQNTQSLEVSILDTTMRIDLAETLFQVIHSELNVNEQDVELVSMHSALLDSITDTHRPEGDYVLMYMHGVYADVLVYDNDMLVGCGSYSGGVDTVIHRMLESKLAPTYRQARSLLSLAQNKDLDDSHAQQIQSLAAELYRDIEAQITQSLGQDIQPYALPRDWYIFTREDVGPIMTRSYSQEYPKRRVVRPRGDVTEYIHPDSQIDYLPFTQVMLGRFFEQHKSEGILR